MASRLPARGEDGHALVLAPTIDPYSTRVLVCQCGAGRTYPPSGRRDDVLDAHLEHRRAVGAPVYKTTRFSDDRPPVPPPGLF